HAAPGLCTHSRQPPRSRADQSPEQAKRTCAVIFKTKKMILTYPHFDPDVPLTPHRASDPNLRVYRVKRVVDSVEYTPGQFLRRETVENLCAMNDWVVVVKEAKS